MTGAAFQICGSCKRAWTTWDSFVLDPAVRLLCLQPEIALPDVNLLVFEHGCGSSNSILSRRLRHLLPEPEPGGPTARLMGTAQCRGHCRYLADLEACDAPCSNARDRTLILLVQSMTKRGIRRRRWAGAAVTFRRAEPPFPTVIRNLLFLTLAGIRLLPAQTALPTW